MPTYATSVPRTAPARRHRLCEQLADDAGASRSQRHADGHLAGAGGAARKQQVGDVDAREQQQQAGGRHDDDQDRPEISDHRGHERLRDIRAVEVGRGKVARQPLHHRRHLRARALLRDTRLQSHEAIQEMIDVVLVELLAEPEVAAVRRVEVARRDAGDRRRDLRKPDRLSHDVRIGTIEILPDAIRDHHDRRRGRRRRSLPRRNLRRRLRRRRWRHEVLPREPAERHRQTE